MDCPELVAEVAVGTPVTADASELTDVGIPGNFPAIPLNRDAIPIVALDLNLE
jgi:hypothetical protein